LPLQQPSWRLQRLRERFHWLLSQLRWQHWRPLWLLWLLWSLPLPLPGLRLVWSPLPSVVLASQVCPRPVPLWPVRLALRWLLLQPLLPLQQQLLLQRPSRSLCRLLSFRYSLLLWSQRLRQLLLQPLQCLRLQRWLVLFRWLHWLLRWLRRPQLSLRLPLWSQQQPLPGLRLVLSPLLSVAPALQVYPRPVPLWPVRFALRWLLLLLR
jgi:hypothetical protein